MIELIYLLSLTTVTLTGLSIYLWRKNQKLKARPDSVELQEFLLDLLNGAALVKVSRVDSANIVLRNRR